MKYKSKRVGAMSPVELNAHIAAIIMKISVITGWQLPHNEEYVRIFQDQLRKKMLEDYKDMNIDEIEYAMRSYGTKIKDWGKSMNISLINEAICEYMLHRCEISSYEERSQIAPRTPLSPGPTDWSDEWERIKEKARSGDLDKVVITSAIYDWLDREGKISLSVEEKRRFMDKSIASLLVEYKDRGLHGKYGDKNEIKMLESGDLNERMRIKVINRAKILVLKMLAV